MQMFVVFGVVGFAVVVSARIICKCTGGESLVLNLSG